MSVIKESFFEASFETKEEFESAEIAAKSDVSDNAELKVTEIKLEKSVIKTNQEKEQPNESEQHSKIVPEVK
jgi:hypothetical protein